MYHDREIEHVRTSKSASTGTKIETCPGACVVWQTEEYGWLDRVYISRSYSYTRQSRRANPTKKAPRVSFSPQRKAVRSRHVQGASAVQRDATLASLLTVCRLASRAPQLCPAHTPRSACSLTPRSSQRGSRSRHPPREVRCCRGRRASRSRALFVVHRGATKAGSRPG